MPGNTARGGPGAVSLISPGSPGSPTIKTTLSVHEEKAELDAPRALWVELFDEDNMLSLSPAKRMLVGSISGEYSWIAVPINGASVWVSDKEGVCLYRSADGDWTFADSVQDAQAGDECGVVSDPAARGAKAPHHVPHWIVADEGTERRPVQLSVLPNPERETSVEQLLVFLYSDMLHHRYERHLHYYVIYIVWATVMICLLPNGLRNPEFAESYWTGRGAADGASREKLEKIGNEDDMWQWLGGTLGLLWEHSHLPLNTSSDGGAYGHVPLLRSRGRGLGVEGWPSWQGCLGACQKHPLCASFDYSPECGSCVLRDKCVNTSSAEDMVPADTTPGTPDDVAALLTDCPDTMTFYALECLVGTPKKPANTLRSRNTSHPGFASYGVSFAVLYTMRAEARWCSATHALSLYDDAKVPVTCAGTYTDRTASSEPFGIPLLMDDGSHVHPYIPSETQNYRHRNVETSASLYSERGYAVEMRYNESFADIQKNLNSLRANGFVDFQTRLVVLSLMLFYPQHGGYFVQFQGYTEFLPTGGIQGGWQLVPFQLVNLEDPKNYFVVISDFTAIFATIMFILSFIWTLRLKIRLKHASRSSHITVFGIWEVFELGHVMSMVVVVLTRFYVWSSGMQSGDDGFLRSLYDMYDSTDEDFVSYAYLNDMATLTDTSNTALAFAVMLSYLRLFKYVQFNRRFNALSETIKGAAYNLVIMTLIFCVVLVAFSLGGCILFGHKHAQFRTFSTSLSYLLRSLVGATMDGWPALHDTRPTTSWLFLVVFFLISWLVLLNMVLAIIAESFSDVQDSLQGLQSHDRSVATSFTSFRQYVTASIRGYCERRRQTSEGAYIRGRYNILFVLRESVCGYDPSALQCAAVMRGVRKWANRERKEGAARSTPDITNERIFMKAREFRDVCAAAAVPLTHMREVHRIFAGAEVQVITGSGGRTRENERQFHHLSSRLQDLEDALCVARERADSVSQTQQRQLEHITSLLQQALHAGGAAGRAGSPAAQAASLGGPPEEGDGEEEGPVDAGFVSVGHRGAGRPSPWLNIGSRSSSGQHQRTFTPPPVRAAKPPTPGVSDGESPGDLSLSLPRADPDLGHAQPLLPVKSGDGPAEVKGVLRGSALRGGGGRGYGGPLPPRPVKDTDGGHLYHHIQT